MIKVKNVTFAYNEGGKLALNDINVSFEKGKYIAILGHNGSGKSTLSKILTGIIKPTSGEVWIKDILLSKKTLNEARKNIGIIFQNPDNQFVGATVEDDIAFGLENKRMSPEKMREIIYDLAKKVDMFEHLEREPQNLSGGQKQRVAIASILALDPSIIIFDEVTSMLDPKGKSDVLTLIRDIQQTREKTLISITHDMDEAILADELLVLSNGKVIAQGSPQEILKNKEIIEKAKIDSPFIYKLSSKLKGISPTYDANELLEQICK
ncbi:energy-coupling factor transporter ATPase [Mesomycoplasma lagogenitalium]|uniref:Energy-coupling factor transporter ATPase n=1 Tax=Mesomycoplasma lagogenitalium TaxID=171286 RepID=A0ABY8LUJ5_9BACT|nr:energy-coupling factor transporter ATPase [Mesomycoplasma lagogenitalium]WGI36904.1 energy-coupling factor transporter ATPase [Mesomycoplasma lagogenitalium]